jgi:hypothetical protein
VDAIDAAIEERKTAIIKLEGEIGSLKLVKRSVDRFKNGPAKRDPNKPKKKKADSPAPSLASADDTTVQRIVRAIEKLNGAALIPAISRESHLSAGLVSMTLQDNPRYFVSAPGGIWKLKE